MKKELSYFLTILAIFTASTFFLFALLKKYSFLTFEHFLEVCRQTSSNLFTSGLHHVGFALSVIATLSMFIFFAKAIFSYIKTKENLKMLLRSKTKTYPEKLLSVAKKNNIQKDKVIVARSKKDIAITIDWSNPKIVLSTGLIEKLTIPELESVILHEYYHLTNKHPLLLLLSEIISSSLFFVPLIKDINRKLRSILENEADNFVRSVQNNSVSLEVALSKITTENSFSTYPSFARRVEYKLSRKNTILSILAVLVGLTLYLFPTQSHASKSSIANYSHNCENKNQCLPDCAFQNKSKSKKTQQ